MLKNASFRGTLCSSIVNFPSYFFIFQAWVDDWCFGCRIEKEWFQYAFFHRKISFEGVGYNIIYNWTASAVRHKGAWIPHTNVRFFCELNALGRPILKWKLYIIYYLSCIFVFTRWIILNFVMRYPMQI